MTGTPVPLTQVEQLQRDLDIARLRVTRADGALVRLQHRYDALETQNVELLAAAAELLEVADLRGDSILPYPSADEKLWTARMQTAWDDLRAVIATQEDD